MTEIQERFNKVIQYSQKVGNQEIHSDELFKKWEKAKLKFKLEYFNGELIYTYPKKISFALNEKSQENRFLSFTEYVAQLIEGGWNNEFIDYLRDIEFSDFYQNSLSKDYITNDNKIIKKKTKVVKSFKYFITDRKLLEDIQNKASEIIQENKIEGYLNFSIHPLDYLSLSETTYNWRSCHALDGEYRGGNLSYMIDSSTVVCYLSNGKFDSKLPRFPEDVPWNSKKWRCLLFFDTKRQAIFAGRQYPFFSPGALEKVRDAFIEGMVPELTGWWQSGKEKWSHWHNDYIETVSYKEYPDDAYNFEESRYFCVKDAIFKLWDVVHNEIHSLQFNDLLRSSCYDKPYYMFKISGSNFDELEFKIGGEVPCLRCSSGRVDDPSVMLCPHCSCDVYVDLDEEDYPVCNCCGNQFYEPEGFWVGDEIICPECYEQEAFVCDICGRAEFNSHKHHIKEEDIFVCESCYIEKQKTEEKEKININMTFDPRLLRIDLHERYFLGNTEGIRYEPNIISLETEEEN